MINKFLINTSLGLLILAVKVFSASNNVSSSSLSSFSSTPPTFVPKVTESPQSQDLDEYDQQDNNENSDQLLFDVMGGGSGGGINGDDLDLNDLFAAASERNRTKNASPVPPVPSAQSIFMSNTSYANRMALSPLFDFIEFIMRPTSPNENIIEAKILPLPLSEEIDSHDDDSDDNIDDLLDENLLKSEQIQLKYAWPYNI